MAFGRRVPAAPGRRSPGSGLRAPAAAVGPAQRDRLLRRRGPDPALPTARGALGRPRVRAEPEHRAAAPAAAAERRSPARGCAETTRPPDDAPVVSLIVGDTTREEAQTLLLGLQPLLSRVVNTTRGGAISTLIPGS